MATPKFITMVSVIVIYALLLQGCAESPPERRFSDTELLIEEKDMPSNWLFAEYSDKTNKDDGEESGAYIHFYYANTSFFVRGGERVYRYSSKRRAESFYWEFEKVYMNDYQARTTSPWQKPQEFKFTSSIAEQERFACAGSSFSPSPDFGKESMICIYLARYEEFIVFFSITTKVDNEVMITYEEIGPIIEAIDRKMGQYLGLSQKPEL